MKPTRRDILRIGGASLAGSFFGVRVAAADTAVEIVMQGNREGSKVWFEPAGVLLRPGQVIRWTNRDRGNTHTATAYHPANEEHPLRIPAGAKPWDSGYLLPDESFETVLAVPGVYDYFCIPHELAGMVGRIVVAEEGGALPVAAAGNPLPGPDGDPFAPVERILAEGRVPGAGAR